jgi:hypothetical protein
LEEGFKERIELDCSGVDFDSHAQSEFLDVFHPISVDIDIYNLMKYNIGYNDSRKSVASSNSKIGWSEKN